MEDERMVPLFKDGQPVEMAVTPKAFFGAKLHRKGEHEMETYAEAGYSLGERYESLEPYDGPRTLRAYERAQADKRAPKAEAKPAAKAEAKA